MKIILFCSYLQSSFAARHKNNQRKFRYYVLYGFGVPYFWILFTLFAEKFRPFPNDWNPVLAEHECFFSGAFFFVLLNIPNYFIFIIIFIAERSNWKTYFLFFLLPAGIHVIINCILFVVTAIHCNRIKRDIHRLRSDEMCTSTKRRRFIILRAMLVLMFYHFLCLHIWVQ